MSTGFDVVIVGGGIHGVGVAQAAAAAGHSVLLLEKTALAAGTSSKSSKLIHGGLRYLEHGALRLVRESLNERRLLLRNAPDLVKLAPFHIPVYGHTHRHRWQIGAGLALYAALGGWDASCRFAPLPRRGWAELDGLDLSGLRAVFRYFDAQTDDAALTRAVMRSAEKLGAQWRAPAEFLGATVDASGVEVRYRAGATAERCRGRVLVNAAGPWVRRVAERIAPPPRTVDVELVQGTHIVVGSATRAGIYYVEHPHDGRAIFIMPHGAHTLIGTTESPFRAEPDTVAPNRTEQDYLLEAASRYFPDRLHPSRVAIVSAYAGLRVLPTGTGRAFDRSRETILCATPPEIPRVLGIYGGKLTTWRATAARVLARLAPGLPTRRSRADTRSLHLEPCE
jgi:glycerol-3-phosphate dehydrogenase